MKLLFIESKTPIALETKFKHIIPALDCKYEQVMYQGNIVHRIPDHPLNYVGIHNLIETMNQKYNIHLIANYYPMKEGLIV